MATSAQPQNVPIDTLQFSATPVQTGDEIRVLVQIADMIGISFAAMLNQKAANALWHTIREGCNAAETTLVKPQPLVTP